MNANSLKKLFLLGLSLSGLFVPQLAYADIDYAKARKELVQMIEQDVRATEIYIGSSTLEPRVMQAMGKVARHAFVPERYRYYSYENRPLPIGHGQTISQPYIVALMTDLLSVRPTDKALEVGTGSGYQAAILAELVDKVYSIEIIDELAEQAASVLEQQGYKNVHTRTGDGYYGWPEQAPFDVIVVTAAAGHIPPPLIKQLKPGGRMVIPVGSRFMTQQLVLVLKDNEGKVTTRQMLPVIFVPLTGEHD